MSLAKKKGKGKKKKKTLSSQGSELDEFQSSIQVEHHRPKAPWAMPANDLP